MKFLLAVALFITTNAFAVDVCSFQETSDFRDALEARNIKSTKKSTNPKRFTFIEKQMVHLTITLESWLSGSTKEEAIEIFGDYHDGKKGFNAGEILYYEIEGKQMALVHYWPGENEYGAFFELKNGAYKLLAEVTDSFITCK